MKEYESSRQVQRRSEAVKWWRGALGALAQPGDLALSLGTSDTLLGVTAASEAKPQEEGHMMRHPTDPDAVFAMLCYKNGGVAREALRDERCSEEWAEFDEALRNSPPGNHGLLGVHLPQPEITPVIGGTGRWYVDADGSRVDDADVPAAKAIRSIIEGRFLSMRARGEALGLRRQRHCVLATGGGSKSSEILQVAAAPPSPPFPPSPDPLCPGA